MFVRVLKWARGISVERQYGILERGVRLPPGPPRNILATPLMAESLEITEPRGPM